MEKLPRSNALNLFLLIGGLGLMLIVSWDLRQPQGLRLEPTPGDSSILEKNWFTERTFQWLRDEQSPELGIDLQLMAELDPFTPTTQVAEPVVAAPPEVKPEVSPPPAATRQVSLVYRGFYRSSDGAPFVYVEVEGNIEVFPMGAMLMAPWRITDVNARQLTLTHDEAGQRQFLFNRKKNLEVPVNPAP